MHYTIKHLRYTEAAARHGSITAAAEALAVSPSSIAAAIDGIEAQLGQPVFVRQPSRGVAATRYGRQFLDELRALLAAQSRFDRRIGEIDRGVDGTVRIACFTPMAPIMLPTILTEVRNRHPNLVTHVFEGSVTEIITAVEDGSADLAIGYSDLMPTNGPFIPLFTAYPHAALPRAHPLASGDYVTLEQLAAEPLVVLDHEHSRKYLMGLFAARDLRPNVVYSARTTDTMRSLIAAGLAYGVFNIRPIVKQNYGTGDLVRLPLAGDHDSPRAGIFHRDDARLGSVASAVVAACREQAAAGAFEPAIVRP
ncbi:LysR family transcriptional regulator [Paracoccus suum]|uniref:LysR family transcriptional regulator n=1 Tax=Paracoccus suum TaxID=2259340 RepID=A0A344PNV2_9RHOB|nr:LysR family transcriptional regulator [Paracoccus suum]AXC51057.1 LysR family transcriptional regulator [Paracoccus suum]